MGSETPGPRVVPAGAGRTGGGMPAFCPGCTPLVEGLEFLFAPGFSLGPN